ncbi:MAG: 30S ribosomal protein S9 [Candidatus Micrarchaeota archaeon]
MAKEKKTRKRKEDAPKAEEVKPETDKAGIKEEPKKAEKPAAKAKTKKAKPKKKAPKVVVARGKRKESIARATIKEGRGTIRVNSKNLESFTNPYMREIVREPLRYMGPEANTVDISVNVSGGGVMGQVQAARTAIANALCAYFEDLNLKERFIDIDRSLVVEDIRRVEPKKFRGPKARARFQKSYR